MTSRYRLAVSQRFRRELQRIYDYIKQDSRRSAERVSRRIVTSMDSLTQFPRRNRIVPELDALEISRVWRDLIVDNYRIVYSVNDGTQTIRILTVFDARRNSIELLARLRDAHNDTEAAGKTK